MTRTRFEPETEEYEARTTEPRGVVDLGRYDNSDFDRGASKATEMAWLVSRGVVFELGQMPLNSIRRRTLLTFGAAVGSNCTIRRGVKITFPWRLEIGDNTWLGEDSWLLNLAPIRIGNNVSISQRAFLCTGNHDWGHPQFRLRTAPIEIHDGAWVGAAAFIGPGVTVGSHTVVTAGSVVNSDLPPYTICGGNPCRPLRERRIDKVR